MNDLYEKIYLRERKEYLKSKRIIFHEFIYSD